MPASTQPVAVARGAERGTALIGVLLLLMMMSALVAALALSGRTETLVARNHQSSAQARAAAEAGLNHAVQVAIDHIRQIDPDAVPNALDTLLADTSLLTGITFGTPIQIAGAADQDAEYVVSLMDEDDPARGETTQITTDGDASNDEDGNALTDNNLTLVIRATGTAQNNTSVTLEALISPFPLPGLVTNGDLTISGNVEIGGTEGGVHSNADLTITGGSASITGDVTASGTYSGMLAGSDGQPRLPLPSIRTSDYDQWADFILHDDGMMTTVSTGVTAPCDPCNYWTYDSGNGTWTLSGNNAVDGTYYVEGAARISGSPPQGANPPIAMTLIATGSITISGSPDLTPETNELLFVTDADLVISGGVDTPLAAEGQMLVHEQLSISGNPSLAGQLIVEDATSLDPTVTANTISGNPTITYSGGLGTNLFSITGWREVR